MEDVYKIIAGVYQVVIYGEFIANLIPDAPITNFYIDDKTGKIIAIDNDEQFYMADLQTQW